MNWIAMTLLLAVSLTGFAYSASRRWRLMLVAKRPENRTDQIGQRLWGVLMYVFAQKRMVRYPLAGWAHIIVFFGFLVLLLNSLILWGRGYVPDFNFWVFGPHQPLGAIYALLRDIFTFLVIVGVLIFFYNRVIARLSRLTLNFEGLLILTIIFTMMIADLVYEGVELNREQAGFRAGMPFASITAAILSPLPAGAQNVLWQVGFWAHSALVLIFLNLLPYGKHFHVLTVLPNVLTRRLTPLGHLSPITDIEGRLEREETLGVKRIQDFSWKDVLDFYTCTECGRCTDNCPANNTGKLLSPKHLINNLRDHLYSRAGELIGSSRRQPPAEQPASGAAEQDHPLVPDCIKPEVLWACTSCAACEEECPVFISFIDKIVDMRRNLVMERGELPEQLQTAFRGLETAGNPYSYPNERRAEWAEGLDVPLMADQPDVEMLYWVGCAASFDDRSRKIARALAQLLKTAGVRFAILGPEEQCNGDPARRAGNEYLFQTLAAANIETLNRYKVKKIVTACPHCYNTLRNEYPDFGGRYEVLHHVTLLAELIRTGRLTPQRPVDARVVYHDACYLGRHNGLYEPPRQVLRAIPGLCLLEADQTRDRGMCCGAGGAQMWKEEEPGHARVNHTRLRQLMTALPPAGADRGIASACPFCKTMLTDALGAEGHENVLQLDIAELLWESVRTDQSQ